MRFDYQFSFHPSSLSFQYCFQSFLSCSALPVKTVSPQQATIPSTVSSTATRCYSNVDGRLAVFLLLERIKGVGELVFLLARQIAVKGNARNTTTAIRRHAIGVLTSRHARQVAPEKAVVLNACARRAKAEGVLSWRRGKED